MTLKEVAGHVGVSASAVSNWEHGWSNVPSDRLPRLAAAFGVSVAKLYEAPDDVVVTPGGASAGTGTGPPAITGSGSMNVRGPSTSGSTGARGQSPGFAERNVGGRVDDLRPTGAVPLPIYRWGSLGDPRDQESAPFEDRMDYPPLGKERLIGPNGFGVDVRGNSMVGRGIQDGDLCWVNPERPYRLGDVVLALISDADGEGGMVIKEYARTEVGECLTSATDTGHSTVVCDQFSIIGPVVWIQRGFPPR